MVRVLALALLFTPPAVAEPFVSDAFGILPQSALSTERAAWSGLRVGDAKRQVQPGEPDSVLIFVGPKALVAGKDDGHAVALSFDQHGNLVQSATATFSLESNGALQSDIIEGIADVLFVPAPVAGTFAAGVTVDARQSPRALYRVTADLESVMPVLGQAQTIRSETLGTIETDPLTDQFGNLVEDGVGATILLSHDDMRSTQLFATVREGKAEVVTLGRDMMTGGDVGVLIGRASGSGTFAYEQQFSAGSPDVRLWALDDIGALGIRIGPVTTREGYLLMDGAPVRVQVSGQNGISVQAAGWIEDGYFETLLRRPTEEDAFEVSYETSVATGARQVAVEMAAPTAIRGVE